MKIKEVLIAGRKLIEDPARWTQGHLARDAEGNKTAMINAGVRWCAAGAVCRVDNQFLDINACTNAWSALNEAARKLHKRPVVWVNDELGHEAVLKVYDLAIANCGD